MNGLQRRTRTPSAASAGQSPHVIDAGFILPSMDSLDGPARHRLRGYDVGKNIALGNSGNRTYQTLVQTFEVQNTKQKKSIYESEHGLIGSAELQEITIKPSCFQVFVKNIDGKLYTFNVQAQWLVQRLREEIFRRLKIPPDQQVLVFEGKNLENQYSLEHYHLRENSTIFLTGRLRGGLR